MTDYYQELLRALYEPLLFLLNPEKRIFGGFLLSSLALSAWVYFRETSPNSGSSKSDEIGENRSPRNFFKFIFPKQLYTHESSRLDYKLIFLNSLLGGLLIIPIKLLIAAPALAPSLVVTAAVSTLLHAAFGEAHVEPWSKLQIATAYSLLAFTLDDFTRFWLHRAMHRLPRLWELHKVHHSAQVLTPFTLYRIHPLESLLYSLRRALTWGGVAGVFFYFFRGNLSGYDVLGINALGFLFNFAGANLRHSHVWLSFGKLEHIFISPAQHQIHHSNAPAHHDKNFGSCFALWDKLYGSLYITRNREPVEFGLPERERNHGAGGWSTIVGPLRAFFRRRSPAAPN